MTLRSYPAARLTAQPIGYWTGQAHRAVTSRIRSDLALEGLSQPHWWVLNHVDGGLGSWNAADLGERLRPFDDQGADFDAVIDDLLDRGWLLAEPIGAGGALRLTAEGAAGLERARRRGGSATRRRWPACRRTSWWRRSSPCGGSWTTSVATVTCRVDRPVRRGAPGRPVGRPSPGRPAAFVPGGDLCQGPLDGQGTDRRNREGRRRDRALPEQGQDGNVVIAGAGGLADGSDTGRVTGSVGVRKGRLIGSNVVPAGRRRGRQLGQLALGRYGGFHHRSDRT